MQTNAILLLSNPVSEGKNIDMNEREPKTVDCVLNHMS